MHAFGYDGVMCRLRWSNVPIGVGDQLCKRIRHDSKVLNDDRSKGFHEPPSKAWEVLSLVKKVAWFWAG